NRPEKRNAITPEMYSALAAQLIKGDEDDTVKVVVLHGTHNCFTSGNDLNNFSNGASSDKRYPHNIFLSALSQIKKPVIAAINGPALGIGTIMLMHCDLVYAAADARFSFPFIKLGLSPEGGTSYLLPRLAGNRKAMEMVLFGDPFGVEDALAIGLINEVASESSALDRAMDRANTLAGQSSDSVQTAKALLKRSTTDAIALAMSRERDVFSERLASDEAQTAINTFLNRRN
ncbi:MAG: enoyl-CoA hydratase-related protein, partial [Desulfuromonadales bacterium]|nr:enoyl-CoA hydratase-related protein [Desulfuromonadales bacterium]